MVKKTAGSISAAVSEYLKGPEGAGSVLSLLTVNIISEKVFTDKHEYVVEISSRAGRASGAGAVKRTVPDEDINAARTVLEDLLSLSGFRRFTIDIVNENGFIVFRIDCPGKDGLLIGKDGRNITSLQYIFSLAMEKKLGRPAPFIIDVDSYREKRNSHLRALGRELSLSAIRDHKEVLTDYLPSYERKVVHEAACSGTDKIRTFSIGRGQYKKVVITTLI